MHRHRLASFLFAGGLTFLLLTLFGSLDFGQAPNTGEQTIGAGILEQSPSQTGAANTVTAVVLGYRGIDTLGELAILFCAATAAGLVLGQGVISRQRQQESEGGFVLKTGTDLLFPLLLTVGLYIIAHGHLTPGGGFQGGVILAATFFVPVLARPGNVPSHRIMAWIESLAGASFIAIGLIALGRDMAFLQPFALFPIGADSMGTLLSAGTLPLLYLALGLKVGAELAGLLTHLATSVVDEGDRT